MGEGGGDWESNEGKGEVGVEGTRGLKEEEAEKVERKRFFSAPGRVENRVEVMTLQRQDTGSCQLYVFVRML